MEKYTKLQKIGQGSFGSAYLITKKHDPLQKKYVLKEIRMDPRDQESALREARLLAALDHPNIIACKESFLSSPLVLCIVTDFADGGDLRKALTERQTSQNSPRAFRESEVLDLFIQVCLALKHLHDRKIIHRDIKPENIFLTKSRVVKLGDFGVATVLSHTLACAQTLTGTPYYTSPEICLGNAYNSKTDVWSLGCVLYELMTFTHAFNGRSQRQLFENIIKANVAPISSSSGYSARLITLVSEMLAKHPRDRPSINHIIKKPIVMERIQGFLVERAIRDELNHTVLHGQHIFHKKGKSTAAAATPVKQRAMKGGSPSPRVAPPPAPSAVKPALVRKPAVPLRSPAPVAGVRKPLNAGIRKEAAKAAASPRHKPVQQANRGAPVVAKQLRASAVPQPTMQQRRVMERKKAIIAKAREDHQQARAGKVAVVPAPTTPVVLPPPPPVSAALSPAQPIADRIAAFNIQWHAQRQQLLSNIAPSSSSPDPPQYSASPAKNRHAPESASPSVVISRGKKPTAAASLAAAKQREGMRRDIIERKRAIANDKRKRAGASTSSPSPLDDPVILVQNLPDFKSKIQKLVAPTLAAERRSDDEGVPEVEMKIIDEEYSSEPPTPDPSDDRSNIEFQRMLLQLKSVVDEPNDDDDEDDEGIGGENSSSTAVVQPLDNTSSFNSRVPFDMLRIDVLEDSLFQQALQARIRGEKELTTVPEEQQHALDWLHHYITTLIA